MAAEPLASTPDVAALRRAVAGRYAVERELGRGGMGVVLLARDLALDRPVAVKLLPGALAAEPALRARFLREARIGAGLSHPHVVPIYAVEEQADVVFFAMAYVDGETLAERVRRAGPLPPGEAARVLREVAWALAYAHGRGVVHRDVKPENVLVERGSGRALVSDFGIARSAAAPSTLTREGEIVGSVAFMSPEQGAGEPVDGRSDLYALGGVGFYLLTGRAPFEGPSAAALLVQRLTLVAPPVASMRPDVPPRLAATVDRCLARAPEGRFPSAEAVADALAPAGDAGAAEIAPAVRSFMRAAEQTLWLVWLIAVFSVLYGLPTLGRFGLGPLIAGVAVGAAALTVDLLRRARELLAEGYGAGDVRRAFAVERRAHEEELRALFDARRTAARRRARRRAWAVVAAGACAKAVTIVRLFRPPPGTTPGVPPSAWWFAATVSADLVISVGVVVALNSSPGAERRFFRFSARLWDGPFFCAAFFRAAGLGRGARGGAPGAGTAGAARPAALLPDALAPTVAAHFPELPALLRRLEAAYAALGAREAEVARAVAAAGIVASADDSAAAYPAAPDDVEAGPRGASGGAAYAAAYPTAATLARRRDALLVDMRRALEATRARRTALAAARENIRVQLLRIDAGVGVPDDLAGDVADARALLDSVGDAGHGISV